MDDDDAAERKRDVLLVGPPLGGEGAGDGYAVLRQRRDRVELGAIRALRDGQPIDGGGELVRLARRGEHERLFDVEVLAELPGRAGATGPAQVATDAYRSGWEAIFGELPSGDRDEELN